MGMKTMNTTRNRSIDLMKFIFSICIIAIHAQVFLNTNLMLYQTIVMGLMRIAVPFFFIAAGYFYYQRITLKQETKPYIMKLVQLFLIFETIEIVFYLLPALGYIEPQAILSYLWTALTIGLGSF
ncbi:MAG: acyltransferase family protein [Coprobacillus sp.]